MFDYLDEFLNDEEVLMQDIKDRMIDEIHTSVSSSAYVSATSVSDSIKNIESTPMGQ